MTRATPFCLRILIWLLILSGGGDKEGNAAVLFPSSHQTGQHRLMTMTDSFFPRAPSSVSISGPGVHGNDAFRQTDVSYSGGSPSRFQSFALYPGYNSRAPMNFYQGNAYGGRSNRGSPFKDLFGSDIGQSAGVYDSFGKTGSRNRLANTQGLKMSRSEAPPFKNNNPFSSIRLTPVSSISGVTVSGPSGEQDPRKKRLNAFVDDSLDNDIFRSNRAHSYDHGDPFEKPISRSAFPMPNVDDPITLDLAEDQVNRVKYAKEKQKLPPPRNFVQKPAQPDSKGDNQGSQKSKGKSSGVALDPVASSSVIPARTGNRLTLPLPATLALPSQEKEQRNEKDPRPTGQYDNEAPSARSTSQDKDEDGLIRTGYGQLLEDPKSKDEVPDSASRRNLDSDRVKFDEPKESDYDSTKTPDSEKIFFGTDAQIYDEDSDRPPNIHAYLETVDDRPNINQESKEYPLNDEATYKYQPDDQSYTDSYFATPLDSGEDNSQLLRSSPKFTGNSIVTQEHPQHKKSGNYDVSTVTQEKIHQKSGKLEDTPMKPNLSKNPNPAAPLSIPATKHVMEETVDSGKRTIVDNEIRLPTDHVGFILTDQFYDDIDGDYNGKDPTAYTDSDKIYDDDDGYDGRAIEDQRIRGSGNNNYPYGTNSKNYITPAEENDGNAKDGHIIGSSGNNNYPYETKTNNYVSPVDDYDGKAINEGVTFSDDQSIGSSKNGGISNKITEKYPFETNSGNYISPSDVTDNGGLFGETTFDPMEFGDAYTNDNNVDRPHIGSSYLSGDGSVSDNPSDVPDYPQNQDAPYEDDMSERDVSDKYYNEDETSFRISMQREPDAIQPDSDNQIVSSTIAENEWEDQNARLIADAGTDPTSLSFNLLDAGEGSLHVRKVKNSFDPTHQEVNTFAASSNQREPQDELRHGLQSSSDVTDSGHSQAKFDESSNFDPAELEEKYTGDQYETNSLPPTGTDTIKKTKSGTSNSNTFDDGGLSTENGEETENIDAVELIRNEQETPKNLELNSDSRPSAKSDSFSDYPEETGDESQLQEEVSENGLTEDDDTEDEYPDLFRPASSYKPIELPEPSEDVFSSSTGGAFASSDGVDGFSLSQQLTLSPFESMFGKTLNQAERGSFGSLFNNIRNTDRDSRDPRDPRRLTYDGSRLDRRTSFQDGGRGASGDDRLRFDDELGQIIQRRPSLDLFGRKWR